LRDTLQEKPYIFLRVADALSRDDHDRAYDDYLLPYPEALPNRVENTHLVFQALLSPYRMLHLLPRKHMEYQVILQLQKNNYFHLHLSVFFYV
jgi:hypothetical protein